MTSADVDPHGPGGPLAWTPPLPLPTRRRRWWPFVLIVVAIVAGAIAFIPLSLVAIAPGSAVPLGEFVSVAPGGPTVFPPKGRIYFVTVSVRERIGPYEYVWDKLRPDIDVITEEQYRGPTPSKQFEQENVVLMADSQEAARLVVLRRLGYPVIDRGALVEALTPGFPSGAVLKPKDLIVAIDGRPVTTAEQAVAAINGHHIGDPIALRIVRGAQTLDVQTRIGAGQGGAPKLGVSISTKVQYPFVVNIDSGNVTGPSAGLAFALELLDKLTPGELTGGASVAATGDLGTDGSVQPIGGAAQKAAAVRARGHIEVFLVPRDGRHEEYREAKAHVGPGVRVYEVGTFDDALRVLATLPGSDAAKYLAPPGSGH